jgi:cytochrome c oxidase subunit III
VSDATTAQATALDERAVRQSTSPVLGMTLFVASEAMFFAAFFGAYFTISAALPVWPPLSIPIPEVLIPSVATTLLLVSSVTVQIGVAAARHGRMRRVNLWLGITIALGVAFLVLQTIDYSRMGFGIHDGIYPSLFYVMTGLHTAHVIGGVAFLMLVFAQSRTGQLSTERHEPLQAAAIYWDFVDLVWVGLFVVFYILPQGGS